MTLNADQLTKRTIDTTRNKGGIPRSMLTVGETSKLLNVHRNTLRRWSDKGIIKSYRIGPRSDRRFKYDDILEVIRNIS